MLKIKNVRNIVKVIVLFYSISFLSSSISATEISAAEKMRHLAQQYEAEFFKQFPEQGIFWGRPHVAQDRFTNNSFAAILAWQKKEDIFLQELNTLDVNSLKGTPESVTYALLKDTLEDNQAARVCKDELWNVNPTFGWHNIMAIVAEKQPVGTEKNRTAAIKRWKTFGTVVDEEIKNLKLGLQQGYSAPKPVVERVLKQLSMMQTKEPEESPFFVFAKIDNDENFRKHIAHIIVTVVDPAIKRYVDFLHNEYLPIARNDVGVWALPQGNVCYQAKIKKMTTLSVAPEKIHQQGLDHMQKLQNEVAELGQKEFGMSNMSDIFQQIKDNPKYFFKSEQDILDYNYAALNKAKAQVPFWFETMPKTQAIVKPYPLHRAMTGASGEYHPSEDGSKPGIFYINTYEPQAQSRAGHEATLYHELMPGHHFQVALTYEDHSHLSLDKYLWNSGYGEGWALYAERLADEMGLYVDNISRLGMMSNEALRSARLVVDPGMHMMHWSREDAIQYMKDHTAFDANIIEGEIDRYIMMPAQATAYMIGKNEIEALRELAKNKLGNQFDIQKFHTQILKNGAVTLPMLRQQVESWLEEESVLSRLGQGPEVFSVFLSPR